VINEYLALNSANVNKASVYVYVVYVYVDVVGIWHKRPLSTQRLRWLNSQCGRPLIAPPFLVRKPARFDPSYVMYTRLLQPSKAVHEWLADLDDIKMTYSELARDHNYDDDDQPETMGRLCNSSLVQRWHGNRRTRIFIEGANGSTGTGRGLSFTWYTTQPSKITGELNCFHLEAKLCGSRALRRHGIYHPRDLLTFDHDEFWQEVWSKRLTFATLNRAGLGRYVDNCAKGTKRRTATQEDFTRGCLLYRIFGQAGEGGFSVQGVYDQFGSRPSYINVDTTTIQPGMPSHDPSYINVDSTLIQPDTLVHHPELCVHAELAYPPRRRVHRYPHPRFRCHEMSTPS
jgi:hypothetical protein